MKLLIDSFWRAAVYCLMPRVIGLSLLPLIISIALSGLFGYFYWAVILQHMLPWLEMSSKFDEVWRWLEGLGLVKLDTLAAPFMVVFSVAPLVIVVVMSLIAVSFFMTPALTRMVVRRRFFLMQRKQGASFPRSLWWSLISVFFALVACFLTLSIWQAPLLAMSMLALIWGWLTYRVMTFFVLAEFASLDECHLLRARHRMSWLAMGVITGLICVPSSLVLALGAYLTAKFVFLIPVVIWIYTLVFTFSSLWFAHFALAALNALRDEDDGAVVDVTATTVIASPHAELRLASPHDTPDQRTPS